MIPFRMALMLLLGGPIASGDCVDLQGSIGLTTVAAPPPADAIPPSDAWPGFRGNQALLGVADVQLPDRLALMWHFKTQGAIKSSPVIADGKVFIGSDDGHVYAINAATGKQIWAYKTQPMDEAFPDELAPVEAPPLVLDGVVYVGGDDAHLHAIDAHTGTMKWRFPTDDRIAGSANWASAPDGKTRFILFGSYDNRLYCLNAATGEPRWTYESDYYINGAPAVADGKIVFGGCDEVLHVVNVADGTKLEQLPVESPIAGSAAIWQDRTYFGHYGNEVVAANVNTGEVQWTYKDREFPYFSSPAVSDQFVVFGGRDRQVHCVKRADGTPVWTFPTGGRVDSSPVISRDKVVVGSDDGRLYLINLTDGQERWSYEIGEALTGSPAVATGLVIIGAEDGVVYAFGPADKSSLRQSSETPKAPTLDE